MENACDLARRFHAAGFEVVVSDVVTADTLTLYRRLLLGCLVVRLYVAPVEAWRRAGTRPVYLTDEEFTNLHARGQTVPLPRTTMSM